MRARIAVVVGAVLVAIGASATPLAGASQPGQQPLTATTLCLHNNTNATYTVTWDVNNPNAYPVTPGSEDADDNKLVPASADGAQPQTFAAGHTQFAVTVNNADGPLYWDLDKLNEGSEHFVGLIDYNFVADPASPVPCADLAVTNTADFGGQVTAGALERYTLVVTNNGPDPATGVMVTDTLPAGMSFQSSLSSAQCGLSGPTVVCNLAGSLAVGASATFTVVAKAPGTPATGLVNSASVSGTLTDLNLANNTAAATTTVVAAGGATASGYVPPGGSLQNSAATFTVNPGGNSVATQIANNPNCGTSCRAGLNVLIPAADANTNLDPNRPLKVIWKIGPQDTDKRRRSGEADEVRLRRLKLEYVDGQGNWLPMPKCTVKGVATPDPCENRRYRVEDDRVVFEILLLSDAGYRIR